MLQEVLLKLGVTNPQALHVTTDSRNCPAGSVFVGLRGEHFDGNQYATQALINGAALVIVDDAKAVCCITPDKYILVNNSLLALQELAREWRRYIGIPIIGITGTNGKTTTKELTAAVLSTRYVLHYTQGNLNNQIGVPLTLLQLNKSHEMAIVEMGASHIGDIKELVDIAEPQYGLITNIGMAHLQGFGSPEGVRKTKGELYDYLREHNGRVFVNRQDDVLCNMASDIEHSYYIDGTITHCAPMLSMLIDDTYPVNSNLIGAYNADNIRAAVSIGLYFNVNINDCIRAIENYVPTNNRSMFKQTESNRLVVDAYNANVSSMNAAIDSFAAGGIDNKLLILGDMLELGDYSADAHQAIVDKIKDLGFKDVLLVGTNFANTNTQFLTFNDVTEAGAYLQQHPVSGQTILLKGSRGIRLETLIDKL